MPRTKHILPAKQPISELLKGARKLLAGLSDSPELDSEILLAHALGVNRSYLRAWPERTLSGKQSLLFEHLIDQRRQGQPIAYLTGEREFWSRAFLVTADVLIPRPESELLVEQALHRLPKNQPATLLDLGTGSGILAITLAIERPDIRVTAIDQSPHALDIARLNAEHLAPGRIHFVEANWFQGYDSNQLFDLILSNPPYISDQDPHLDRGDLRFEPREALASGADGLDDIRIIIQEARRHLKPGGSLLLEHGYRQAPAVAALLQQHGYKEITHDKDLQGHWRCSMARYGITPN